MGDARLGSGVPNGKALQGEGGGHGIHLAFGQAGHFVQRHVAVEVIDGAVGLLDAQGPDVAVVGRGFQGDVAGQRGVITDRDGHAHGREARGNLDGVALGQWLDGGELLLAARGGRVEHLLDFLPAGNGLDRANAAQRGEQVGVGGVEALDLKCARQRVGNAENAVVGIFPAAGEDEGRFGREAVADGAGDSNAGVGYSGDSDGGAKGGAKEQLGAVGECVSDDGSLPPVVRAMVLPLQRA